MRARDGAAAAVAATAFLTRLPVGRLLAVRGEDLARGAALFPLVGAGTGALVGWTADAGEGRLGALLAAALAVALEALLTGAIHLDALADAADGLGARTRERALAVMREPALGAFGVAALVLALLVKTAALAALAAGPDPVLAAAAAFAVGRAAPLGLAWALPYARPDGTGLALAGGGGRPWLGAGLALGAALAPALLGLRGVALLGAAAVVALAVGLAARRRLGGVTGDVLGAGVELATVAALVAAAASV